MAKIKRVPEEILDEEHEQVLHRVCAIDVAKDAGQVCVRTPRPDGRRSSQIWAVEATTTAVLKLGETLLERGVQMVTLESTSDYWRIFYYLLEASGLPVQLVNARDVKNAPGRPKSDLLTEPFGITAALSLDRHRGSTRFGDLRAFAVVGRCIDLESAMTGTGHSA
jgi:Transposase